MKELKKFEISLDDVELSKRIRAILGVPDTFLTDEVISSPLFKLKAERYINKKLEGNLDKIAEDDVMPEVAATYYMGYLLCPGMYARLPKQMENLSTKTVLQNIDWDAKAIELLQRANETIDEILNELDINTNIYVTMADLSDVQDFPNPNPNI